MSNAKFVALTFTNKLCLVSFHDRHSKEVPRTIFILVLNEQTLPEPEAEFARMAPVITRTARAISPPPHSPHSRSQSRGFNKYQLFSRSGRNLAINHREIVVSITSKDPPAIHRFSLLARPLKKGERGKKRRTERSKGKRDYRAAHEND